MTNEEYFDSISIEKAAYELTDAHNRCVDHKFSKDSYASPAFSEFKKTALTLDDIPMESYNDSKSPIRDELDRAPWEDSIKNFIFDAASVKTSRKFKTCILLSEVGYKYQEATIHMIAGKYGRENVTLLDVIPYTIDDNNDCSEFKLQVRHKDVKYESIIEGATLVSNLAQWYEPGNTLVFCHDSFIAEYRDSISLMSDSTWSISCTCTNFIVNKDDKQCSYTLPNFACSGSLETRAVSTGTAVFTDRNAPSKYKGKLNHYSRCVRTSRHFSGKCYDCKVLERTVEDIYKAPTATPLSSKFIKFSPTFSNFMQHGASSMSDSGYGST